MSPGSTPVSGEGKAETNLDMRRNIEFNQQHSVDRESE